jgi:hypothetical protein
LAAAATLGCPEFLQIHQEWLASIHADAVQNIAALSGAIGNRGIAILKGASPMEEAAMPVDVTYPHIEKIEGSPARLKRLPLVRIAQIVIDYLNHGWSADEICLHYPHLKRAEVHSAMTCYFDHPSEIDGEIEAEQREIEESRKNAKPTPVEQRLRAQGLLPPPAKDCKCSSNS